MIADTDYPNYIRKMNSICVKKCGIDLTEDKHEGRSEQKNHYLSNQEAACVEACATLYVRQADAMINGMKKKLIQ